MTTFPQFDISDDFAAHVRRGSAEPGIDFKTPYGTPVRAPQSGKVIIASNSNAGGSGRRVTISGSGSTWDIIHLSSLAVRRDETVNEGDVIGYSGASGFGKDWYYGPHVHISYWPVEYSGTPVWDRAQDFAHMIGNEDEMSDAQYNELNRKLDWLMKRTGGTIEGSNPSATLDMKLSVLINSLREVSDNIDWLKKRTGGTILGDSPSAPVNDKLNEALTKLDSVLRDLDGK